MDASKASAKALKKAELIDRFAEAKQAEAAAKAAADLYKAELMRRYKDGEHEGKRFSLTLFSTKGRDAYDGDALISAFGLAKVRAFLTADTRKVKAAIEAGALDAAKAGDALRTGRPGRAARTKAKA